MLDSEHPVRVFDGDDLVGVVDDEAILRVVVAEDELVEEPAAKSAPVADTVAVEQGAAR